MEDLKTGLNKLGKEFEAKGRLISEEDLRLIKNDLTAINLAVDRMGSERDTVYRLTNRIKDILKTYDEKQDS